MYPRIIANLILSTLVLLPQAYARDYEGITFPDSVTLPGSDVQLQLNGIGMRTKLFFDIYIGALYTRERADTRDAVQALKGPNRVLMHFVYDEVSRDKLVSAWNDGFESNNSDDELSGLRERIQRFNALFDTVKAGDVILLDYVPGKGTRVTVEGVDKGIIEGEDFNAALLDIWLGSEPADSRLKQAMLGKE